MIFLFSIIWLYILIKLNNRCPFLKYLHLYCPGCGGTRMIISIIHLDFYQAFRYNPLLFILFVLGIIYVISMIFMYFIKRIIIVPSYKLLIGIIILLIIYMIIRNIDTFIYLIPTEV